MAHEVIGLCQELVKRKSYSGEEKLVADYIANYLKEEGFDEVIVDKYGSVIGKMIGDEKGNIILFDGHIDTVPVEDESKWTHDPFAAEIVDGKIYGRGTSDMKGQVAAMIVAIKDFKKATNGKFKGEVCISCSVHEECFEGVAPRNVTELVKPDYVIIGESTGFKLHIAQKGRAEIMVETFGKPAHSSNPHIGVNAVYKMTEVITEIKKIPFEKHPVLGEGILELTDIKSAPYPGASVVPEYCMATYDRRLLVGETKESVLKPLQALLDEMMSKDPELKAKVSYAVGEELCYTGNKISAERFFPAWLYEETEPYIQSVLKGFKEKGLETEVSNWYFCTNGSHFAGEAGIKTLGIGPSYERMAHIIDEYIDVEMLVKSLEYYNSIIFSLLDC